MEWGVRSLDNRTLTVTTMADKGRLRGWMPPPLAYITKGIVQRWWVDVSRLAHVVPGQNKYLETPMGNLRLSESERMIAVYLLLGDDTNQRLTKPISLTWTYRIRYPARSTYHKIWSIPTATQKDWARTIRSVYNPKKTWKIVTEHRNVCR